MKRWLGTLSAFAVALAPAAAAADAPHDQAFTNDNCNNCHALFVREGAGVDSNAGCVACHNSIPNSSHAFPWLSSDQASPAQMGNQHSWTGTAANPRYGARSPTNLAVAAKLVNGRLQCATCHDPHHAAPQNAPDERHTSIPVGTAVDESGGPAAGTGTMTLVSPGTAAKSFRVKIQTASAGGGTFVVSHDFGLATPSWFNWNGSAWVVGTVAGPGKPYTNGADVTLDDPAVAVRFTAGAVADNYWDFYVSYPFLRVTNVEDAFCRQCHFERFMGSVRVRGADGNFRPNGVRRFSHPVNEAIGSNGKGYDRPAAAILDADGVTQTVGDGNPTNDLALHSGGVVRCTTCHAAHNADSNSLSQ